MDGLKFKTSCDICGRPGEQIIVGRNLKDLKAQIDYDKKCNPPCNSKTHIITNIELIEIEIRSEGAVQNQFDTFSQAHQILDNVEDENGTPPGTSIQEIDDEEI